MGVESGSWVLRDGGLHWLGYFREVVKLVARLLTVVSVLLAACAC